METSSASLAIEEAFLRGACEGGDLSFLCDFADTMVETIGDVDIAIGIDGQSGGMAEHGSAPFAITVTAFS